ncbi:MAG: hypothetical protein EBU90_30895, partial [Proteobacteria bacterium]|nr:hypothetical protein [Pseudomonadota bacterium]
MPTIGVLTPVVSANPPFNPNIGWNNSWVTVENDQHRHLYAQATFLTNPGDIQITLSAGNISLGNVKLQGGNTPNALADVVYNASGSTNSLRVLTQDLES